MPTIDYTLPGCTCALGGMGRRADCPHHGEKSGFSVSVAPESWWEVTETAHDPKHPTGCGACRDLVDSAIGIAGATGSTGATARIELPLSATGPHPDQAEHFATVRRISGLLVKR